MREIEWKELAAKLICLFFAILLALFCLRYLFGILLPFLAAWLLSLAVRPMAKRFSAKTGIPRTVWAVLLPILFFVGSAALIGFAVWRGGQELSRLLSRLLSEDGQVGSVLTSWIAEGEGIISRLPWFSGMADADAIALRTAIEELLTRCIGGIVTSLASALPELAARLLSALPSVFLMLLVGVIASFYFCLDGERITNGLFELLPPFLAERAQTLRKRVKKLSFRYVRAYLWLLLITFASLFVGLSILRVEYAFLLSAIIAVIDLFPVLGVGTVLIPWALIALLRQNFYLGFGLLILYVALLILRQILEPRLVGGSLGIHPLLTLFAGYAGFRLFGFLGMLLGPFVALLLKILFSQLRRDSKKRL